MPLYSYKAKSSQGISHSGYRFASSKDAIFKSLKAEGLLLTHCQVNGEEHLLSRFSSKASPKAIRGIPQNLIIDFCYHMALLDEAGVPINNALHDFASSISHRGFRTLLYFIYEDLQAGVPLSEGLAKYPKVFGHVFEQLIRAAEQTGTFAPQFRHLEAHLCQQETLKYKIRKSIRSPLILMGLMTVLILVMVQLVIPNMTTLLSSLGEKELPLSTRLLLNMASFLGYIPLILFVTIGLGLLGHAMTKTRLQLEKFILRFSLYQSLAINHFWHVFAVMMCAGVDLIPSLNQAVQAVQNSYLRDRLGSVAKRISEGTSLSKAFQEINQDIEQETALVSPFMMRLLTVGEQTGTLRKIIPQAASYHQTQAFRQMETLVSWLEPVLILIMGALMLWIVLAVIVPFYGTLGDLS